jgi:hypothetical protein
MMKPAHSGSGPGRPVAARGGGRRDAGADLVSGLLSQGRSGLCAAPPLAPQPLLLVVIDFGADQLDGTAPLSEGKPGR